jgi:GxxExxY protein
MDLIYKDLSNKIIGAAIEVHKSLGPGFLEAIYESAFKIELSYSGIPFECQKPIEIMHRGQLVGRHRLDFVVQNLIVVEVKAVDAINNVHFAQIKSYLKATGLKLGLLLNFKKPTLVVNRFVL